MVRGSPHDVKLSSAAVVDGAEGLGKILTGVRPPILSGASVAEGKDSGNPLGGRRILKLTSGHKGRRKKMTITTS